MTIRTRVHLYEVRREKCSDLHEDEREVSTRGTIQSDRGWAPTKYLTLFRRLDMGPQTEVEVSTGLTG